MRQLFTSVLFKAPLHHTPEQLPRRLLWYAALLLLPAVAFGASGNAQDSIVVHKMSNLVLQIGTILFAARIGGIIMERLQFPSVLGELLAGILIGPSLLGSVALPGLPQGIFPHSGMAGLAVSHELYGIATLASIVLLFFAGLETDLELFLRYSVTGTIVGIGGVVVSFVGGSIAASLLLHVPLNDMRALFLGVITTATSVGITVRILSHKHKVDTPEGVTLMAGAVIDDILGIILLAVISAAVTVMERGAGQAAAWGELLGVIAKAFGVWLGFTTLGLVFSRYVSRFLKSFHSITTFSVLALGMALMLAGIFEKAGLAMIIGAYVMGITLSKTDLAYVIQDSLHTVYALLVPVFFAVMGMLVDVPMLLSPAVLSAGLIYSAVAIGAKLVGCSIPALFLNFNLRGAIRIGLGMIPRGEVALIIAGIGLSTGILEQQSFGIAVLMTLLTTLVAPPLLNRLLDERPGTRRERILAEKVTLPYDFASNELTDLLETRVLQHFTTEGYYIHTLESNNHKLFHIRMERSFITLIREEQSLIFKVTADDVAFVKTMVFESLLNLHRVIDKIKNQAEPAQLRQQLAIELRGKPFDLARHLDMRCIEMDLTATTKSGIVEELVNLLARHGKLGDKQEVLGAICEREQSMSTGMQYGVALPHAKSDGVSRLTIAIGFKHEGVDFKSLDGQPARVFIMIISPLAVIGPHIQCLASIGALLSDVQAVQKLLVCRNEREVYSFFTGKKPSGLRAILRPGRLS